MVAPAALLVAVVVLMGQLDPTCAQTTASAGCGPGTYAVGAGASCQACPAGKYLPTEGNDDASDCVDCMCGTYSTVVGASSIDTCQHCGAGKYGTDTGNVDKAHCEQCGAGTYSDGQGNCHGLTMGMYPSSMIGTAGGFNWTSLMMGSSSRLYHMHKKK